MEKLKIALVGAVLLLAAAVVYGYVDDGAQEQSETSATVVESPPEAAPPQAPGSVPGDGPAGSAEDTDGRSRSPEAKDEGKAKPDKPKKKREGSAKAAGSGQSKQAPAPDASGSTSEAEFAGRAEAICAEVPRQYEKRIKQVQAGGGAGVDQVALIGRVAPPVLFEAARKLAKVEPPADAEADAKAMVAALERAAKSLQKDPAKGLSEGDVLTDFTKLAKRYGLKRCSRL